MQKDFSVIWSLNRQVSKNIHAIKGVLKVFPILEEVLQYTQLHKLLSNR